MISEQLYVWHHTHFTYDIICTIHNITSTLWVHTIVVTTLHPLHSWHHTHYIQHHMDDNTKIISTISSSISDTKTTVSISSIPVCQLCYNHSLYDITHSMYNITFSMHDITWTLYDITPDVNSCLIWKDPDAGKDWRWEEKESTEDEMVGWHHQLNGHEFE